MPIKGASEPEKNMVPGYRSANPLRVDSLQETRDRFSGFAATPSAATLSPCVGEGKPAEVALIKIDVDSWLGKASMT
jgi:hypothetical protein